MSLRGVIKEGLILEGRLDDAKQFVIKDFQDALIPQSYKDGRRMPEWFQTLVNNDPSGNQKYLMWSLKQIKKHVGRFHPFIVPDPVITKVTEGVKNFHEIHDKLTKENIDKVTHNSGGNEFNVLYGQEHPYFKFRYPIEELYRVIKNPKDINSYYDFYLLWELTEAIKKIPNKSDIKKEALKLYDDQYWLVIIPLTHRASCSYGANTRWCTTSKDSQYFDKYQSNVSSLFYFMPKANPLKSHQDYFIEYMDEEYDLSKIALHMNFEGDLIFFDASDGEIEGGMVSNMVEQVYGLDSAKSFWGGVMKAESYHNSKLDR